MVRNAQRILKLEREIRHLETILARRDMYVEMIDWTAMTAAERDWAEYEHSFEIYMTLWELDTQLVNIDVRRWGYQ